MDVAHAAASLSHGRVGRSRVAQWSVAPALVQAVGSAAGAAWMYVPRCAPLARDSALADVLCGSVAGITSKVIEHPFDTVKVQLQVAATETKGHTDSAFTLARQSVADGGLRALYRGLAPPVLGAIGENAILFAGYSAAQDVLREVRGGDRSEPLSVPLLAVAGGASGFAVSFLLTPVELIKCRVQVQPGSGALSVLRELLKREGPRALYKGYAPTLAREVAGGMAWFGVYESVLRRLESGRKIEGAGEVAVAARPGTAHALTAGALAGLAYNAALYPADVVKSVQQTQRNAKSLGSVARALYSAGGVRALYRGFGITALRSGPSSAALFWTYEAAREAFTTA